MRKTLNEHLFEQLDRISECDADNIDLEINKTNAMIAVSEQILNVARLKMDIIQAKSLEQFTEIDVIHSEPKLIENEGADTEEELEDDFDKKKLAS